MAPKKKVEEEAPPPEECLPAGYSVGCQIYWLDESLVLEESGEVLKVGMKGTLVGVPELREFEREDGSKGWSVEVVEANFEGIREGQKVPIKSLSLEPAPLDMLDELSTGIKLPLTGRRVDELWAAQGDLGKQAKMIEDLLRLNEAYSVKSQRDIVRDFWIFNLAHAKSICLGSVHAAVFLAIMDRMLAMMKSDSVTGRTRPQDMCSVSSCFKEFERLILMHSTNRPPECMALFKGSEARLLTDFASTTLFKHFLLYQYCVSFDQEVQTLRFATEVQRPLAPLDLNGARERPNRSKEEASRSLEACEAAEGWDQPGQEASPEDEELTEEQEIERLVAEKLRETEAKLEAKLAERESAFLARLEEETAKDPKKKGKK